MAAAYIRKKIVPENPVKVGARFSRLTVISDGWERVSASGHCSDMVQVQCDCGTVKFIRPRSLWPRGVQSCGCLQKEVASALGSVVNLKHGHSKKDNPVPEYRVYATMLSRCYNPNSSKFATYGGRGISVCDRWRGDGGYERFIADMGRRPDGGSLDRIDPNGHYEPANCRWASMIEQQNNRRSNVFLEMDGRRQTLTQWAREYGINAGTLRTRLETGMPLGQALTMPVERRR
jgi:hypothetical protein